MKPDLRKPSMIWCIPDTQSQSQSTMIQVSHLAKLFCSCWAETRSGTGWTNGWLLDCLVLHPHCGARRKIELRLKSTSAIPWTMDESIMPNSSWVLFILFKKCAKTWLSIYIRDIQTMMINLTYLYPWIHPPQIVSCFALHASVTILFKAVQLVHGLQWRLRPALNVSGSHGLQWWGWHFCKNKKADNQIQQIWFANISTK